MNKKARRLRHSLLMSMLSMILCISMLMGTTFAWFTDEVKSVNNIIKSGNLDIELYYQNDKTNDWTKVGTDTNIFKENTLWEPGYTEVVYFKVVNEGSLALKYKFGINVVSETPGTNVAGDTFYLSNHIEFDVIDLNSENDKFANRDAARAAVQNADKIADGYVSGDYTLNLKPDEEKIVAFVVYMPETVGNEANYRGNVVPKIDLGINLLATQYTVEEDSFDENYDKEAPRLVWDGKSDTSWYNDTDTEFVLDTPAKLAGLAKLVNEGNTFSGKTIKLGADMDLDNKTWTPIGDGRSLGTDSNGNSINSKFGGKLDGNGYIIYNLKVTGTKGVGLIGFAGNAAHIENVHIIGAEVTGINSVGAVLGYGYLSADCLRNCTVENAKVYANDDGNDNGDKVGAVAGWTSNGHIIGNKAINCEVYGCRDMGGIVGYINGENRAIEASGNFVENVTLTVLSVANYTEPDKLGTNINNTVGRTGSRVTVTNNFGECTIEGAYAANDNESFEEAINEAILNGENTIYIANGNYIIPDSAQGKTLTIIGNGESVIATQDDGSYEGCDYSLDGATVTFENIVINTDSTTYTGYARLNATYNNCTINGTYTLYGDSVFNDCTFNVTGDVYNIWTWGAPKATFNNCTFNSDGKALLLYGTVNTNLTVNNCVFNDKGGLSDLKAAIEVGNDYGKSYTLTVNNTVVNGYEYNDKGIFTGTKVYGNKNSMPADKLIVTIDGVKVSDIIYKNISTAADLADLSATALTGNNGKAEEAVIIITNDIDMNNAEFSSVIAQRGDKLTVIGNGHKISNVKVVSGANDNTTGQASMFYAYPNSTLTVSDLILENITVTAEANASGYAAAVVGYCEGAAVLNNVDIINADVTGVKSSGMLVGHLSGSLTATDCEISGTVKLADFAEEANGHYAGKYIGTLAGPATLTGCTVDVTVSGNLNAANIGDIYGRATTAGSLN